MNTSVPQRILIVRLSAIGDTIHSLPLAAALRKLYPGCFLGWLVEKPAAALIRGNPLLDWFHVVPKGWLKSPGEVWRLRRELRAQRFDTVFDVQGLSKSAVAAWLSGARRRIGFSRGEGREIAPVLDTLLVAPRGKHAVDMTLSLLDALGVEAPGPAEFVLPPCSEADGAAIDAVLSRSGYAGGFVLLGPWGSFSAKLWPLERFVELAEGLKERTGMSSLMLGHGGRERSAVEGLAGRCPGALAIAPDVDLAGVAELARRAALFVGCDSFPMHVAAAVGCRTVGLFGVTDPERLGPYGLSGRSVSAAITLVRSTRERKRLGNGNMLALPSGVVLQSCLELLSTVHAEGVQAMQRR